MCHKGQTPRVTDDFRAFSENEKRVPLRRGRGLAEVVPCCGSHLEKPLGYAPPAGYNVTHGRAGGGAPVSRVRDRRVHARARFSQWDDGIACLAAAVVPLQNRMNKPEMGV